MQKNKFDGQINIKRKAHYSFYISYEDYLIIERLANQYGEASVSRMLSKILKFVGSSKNEF